MNELSGIKLPKIIESETFNCKDVKFRAPLNYFLDMNKNKTVQIYRFFWMKSLEKYYASQSKLTIKVEIGGRAGFVLKEKREGKKGKAEMTSYFVDKLNSWELVLETFSSSKGLLRVNKSHKNGFPKMLSMTKPYKSFGRVFRLEGEVVLKAGSRKVECLKISMKKEPSSGQKGVLLFYTDKEGNLLYKANYHPKSQYPTVSEKHFIVEEKEKYGLLHCSIRKDFSSEKNRL